MNSDPTKWAKACFALIALPVVLLMFFAPGILAAWGAYLVWPSSWDAAIGWRGLATFGLSSVSLMAFIVAGTYVYDAASTG